MLLLYGFEVHPETQIGNDFRVQHRGIATVIQPRTTIGDRVRIYQQVTIGRQDAHLPECDSAFERCVIEDDVVIFPGAKVLCGPGVTRIGEGAIVAANAVVTTSVGPWEVWGGVPAKFLTARPVGQTWNG